ncbi:hypothetical protein EVAR_43330_1 [Eumeta japonica]|uniref:CHK kinase-like domain-containing protein n=1 Tax=Eumeta variegata TaxID=151549 RepID=A0A4C1WSD7_EUMVA|nr:hypothetical protein EVAR_43330_1 [Eumeta japonica]
MSIVETGERDYVQFDVGTDVVVKTANEVELTPPVEKSLSMIIKNHGFVDAVVERKTISNRGGNYLGVLYEVNVRDRMTNGRSELNLFVKCIIPEDKMTMLSVRNVYAKEAYAYHELSKVYEELQSAADVPESERYHFVKCYGIVDERGSEAVILENMSKLGFSTCDRMACMSVRFAELSVMELAKFHALSYVLEKLKPEYFERVIRPTKTPLQFNDDWRTFLRSVSQNTLQIFESITIKEKIVKFIENMLAKMPSLFDASERSVLCHGDYRANNILIKEEDGDIVEVVPVDYQLTHLGNALNDFIYLVFGASDQNFRSAHLHSLKNLYRDTMDHFLRYFDIDLETLYPKEVFEQNFKERLVYGLMIGINFLPIILAPEGDVPDFGETNFSDIKITSSDVSKKEYEVWWKISYSGILMKLERDRRII